MYYNYVLQSLKDNDFYTGCTNDLRKRLEMHNRGLIKSTKNRCPFKIIYYEICKKEAKETMHWLRMLAKADDSIREERRQLWSEAKEINLIFNSIYRKVKAKV